MSLARFMTRMLALSALMPQPGDPDLITMAGDSVFDSRLDPLSFTEAKKELPAIIVYTDDDEHELLNTAAGASPPYQRHLTLSVEIAIGSFDTVQEGGRSFQVYGLPSSDAEVEAKLDLFEQQVLWALMRWARPATAAFCTYVMRIKQINSVPHRDEGGNNRLAARRLTFKLQIRDDCPPYQFCESDGPFPPQRPLLPDDFPVVPWLREMLVAVQRAPSMKSVLNVLAQNGSPTIILPAIKRICSTFDPVGEIDAATFYAAAKNWRGSGRPAVLTAWEYTDADNQS